MIALPMSLYLTPALPLPMTPAPAHKNGSSFHHFFPVGESRLYRYNLHSLVIVIDFQSNEVLLFHILLHATD